MQLIPCIFDLTIKLKNMLLFYGKDFQKLVLFRVIRVTDLLQ